MEIQKSSGIVLSSRDSGESDILCQVLTSDRGKEKFIFKGLKKSRKRGRSAADPGTILTVIYYRHDGREVQVVSDFSIDNSFPGIRENLDKIYQLHYLLEIVEKTVGFNDENAALYRLLAAGICELEKSPAGTALPLFFTIHLLRLHGILPDMDRCSACGAGDYARFSLDLSDLHLLCSDCGAAPRYLDQNSKEFLHASLRKKFSLMNPGVYQTGALKDLLFDLIRFMESYFHIDIKTGICLMTDPAVKISC